MLKMFNGNRFTSPAVHPKNWKTAKASADKDWYITYYIHYPNGTRKLVMVKGMNRCKEIAERRFMTQEILDDLLCRLTHGDNVIKPEEKRGDILFMAALHKGKDALGYQRFVTTDIKSILNKMAATAKVLHFSHLTIEEVSRKHYKAILEYQLVNDKKFSPARYNKARAYLMRIYRELIEMEIVDHNPIRDLSKKPTIRKLRSILSTEEILRIDRYIKEKEYRFWRFMRIFFYSGSRITEVMKLRNVREDVDLQARHFKVTVIKGQNRKESLRPIPHEVVDLWQELLDETPPGQYFWGRLLKPGLKGIRADQITRRWERYVKDQLGINKDFYGLKHLYADAIAAKLDIHHAAAADGHTNIRTTMQYYAVGEEGRKMEKIKNAGIKFG